jgi:hypothetical protein
VDNEGLFRTSGCIDDCVTGSSDDSLAMDKEGPVLYGPSTISV